MDYFYLPKEIIDHIGEFNADHRTQLNLVLSEFMDKLPYFAKRCANWDCECILSYTYIQTTILFENYQFCSTACMDEREDSIRYYYRRATRRGIH
jgi:hypothetical protein